AVHRRGRLVAEWQHAARRRFLTARAHRRRDLVGVRLRRFWRVPVFLGLSGFRRFARLDGRSPLERVGERQRAPGNGLRLVLARRFVRCFVWRGANRRGRLGALRRADRQATGRGLVVGAAQSGRRQRTPRQFRRGVFFRGVCILVVRGARGAIAWWQRESAHAARRRERAIFLGVGRFADRRFSIQQGSGCLSGRRLLLLHRLGGWRFGGVGLLALIRLVAAQHPPEPPA